jgi:hypothetical protein
MVELTRVFRQSDQAFVRLLSEVRQGRVTPATQAALQELARPLPPHAGIEPTKLFPTNVEVDNINTRRLNEVPLSGP